MARDLDYLAVHVYDTGAASTWWTVRAVISSRRSPL
jgi:hypothetical protein